MKNEKQKAQKKQNIYSVNMMEYIYKNRKRRNTKARKNLK